MADDEKTTTQRPTRPGAFFSGDPRRRNGRPAGLPDKKNRAALSILRAAQEECAKNLVEMTKPTRTGVPCPLCGAGMPRPEEVRIKANSEVMDRGGTPKLTRVEIDEKPDMDWVEYATAEEAHEVFGIIEACRGRMPINDEDDDGRPEETEVVN